MVSVFTYSISWKPLRFASWFPTLISFICFVSPLTQRIYFVIIYLYVIHSRREDSLTRKTNPNFYVGITKNSVDCLNAGNLF